MAHFPLTNYDFPNVSNYDGDLRELLAYVKQLSDAYNGIGELVEKIEKEFDRQIVVCSYLEELKLIFS